jgi:hypothetical protein
MRILVIGLKTTRESLQRARLRRIHSRTQTTGFVSWGSPNNREVVTVQSNSLGNAFDPSIEDKAADKLQAILYEARKTLEGLTSMFTTRRNVMLRHQAHEKFKF